MGTYGVYFFYGSFCVCGAIFVFLVLPETK